MTHTIAVANQKGGVGKTTTVINVGVALAEMNKKTLLVDLDPQGALSAGLGVDANTLNETVYNTLIDPNVPVNRVIRPVKAYLDVLPANRDLAAAEIELIPELRRELILRRVLKPLDTWYDYIFSDCPPSLSLLTVNALSTSQGVVIPVQCEFFAMRVIQLLVNSIEKTKARLNPDLELTGILATMYSTGTIHAREVLDEIRSTYEDKVFDTVIYSSIRFAEASVAHKAMIEYSSKHKGAVAYRKIAKQLIQKVEGE
jgi:chromosome partitioning protein